MEAFVSMAFGLEAQDRHLDGLTSACVHILLDLGSLEKVIRSRMKEFRKCSCLIKKTLSEMLEAPR